MDPSKTRTRKKNNVGEGKNFSAYRDKKDEGYPHSTNPSSQPIKYQKETGTAKHIQSLEPSGTVRNKTKPISTVRKTAVKDSGWVDQSNPKGRKRNLPNVGEGKDFEVIKEEPKSSSGSSKKMLRKTAVKEVGDARKESVPTPVSVGRSKHSALTGSDDRYKAQQIAAGQTRQAEQRKAAEKTAVKEVGDARKESTWVDQSNPKGRKRNLPNVGEGKDFTVIKDEQGKPAAKSGNTGKPSTDTKKAIKTEFNRVTGYTDASVKSAGKPVASSTKKPTGTVRSSSGKTTSTAQDTTKSQIKKAWNAQDEMRKRREAAQAQGKGTWNAEEEMRKRREAAMAKKKGK